LPQLHPLGRREPVAGGVDVDLPGDDIRLRATRWFGDGTPVLFLHGLASQRFFWGPVVRRLDGLPAVTFDQRGHGDSEQPTTGYDTATIVRDASTALDALGWQKAVVVGHSWGAGTALALAAGQPQRVKAVVAIDGGIGGPRPDRPRDEVRRMLEPPRLAVDPDEVPALLRGYTASFWSAEVEQAMLPTFGVGDDGLARSRLPFDVHMQIVDALLDAEPESVLAQVTCPAWLVSAEPIAPDDPGAAWTAVKAAGLQKAATLLEQPRLLRWAGAVHDVPLQWPALVAGLVRAAVSEVDEVVEGVPVDGAQRSS
jgi:pimeloyl-ACP methyl ester carboxylesterase